MGLEPVRKGSKEAASEIVSDMELVLDKASDMALGTVFDMGLGFGMVLDRE